MSDEESREHLRRMTAFGRATRGADAAYRAEVGARDIAIPDESVRVASGDDASDRR